MVLASRGALCFLEEPRRGALLRAAGHFLRLSFHISGVRSVLPWAPCQLRASHYPAALVTSQLCPR